MSWDKKLAIHPISSTLTTSTRTEVTDFGKPARVAVIMGTRPEAIKLAPVCHALAADSRLDLKVICTAQHREMLDDMLQVFKILPNMDLDIMRAHQSLEEVTTRALSGLGACFREIRPDLVVVQGDTTTVLTGALAAFYLAIPVAHVEAGLRTQDMANPFPEEANRRLTSCLAKLHFAATWGARANLVREGVPDKTIMVTGNPVIDALRWILNGSQCALKLPVEVPEDRRLVLITAHRRESHGAPLRNICSAIARLANEHPDTEWVYPVHPNPNVQEVVDKILSRVPRVHLIRPQSYGSFVALMNRSYLVLTDSGGVQEEAPSLGKPVLVLRNVTERPEAVDAGTVRVIGTEADAVYLETKQLLTDPNLYRQMAEAVNPYGDGQAAARILGAILHFFGLSDERPEEFHGGALLPLNCKVAV